MADPFWRQKMLAIYVPFQVIQLSFRDLMITSLKSVHIRKKSPQSSVNIVFVMFCSKINDHLSLAECLRRFNKGVVTHTL